MTIQQPDRKTVFDLEQIIKRCFEESTKAGDIQVLDEHNTEIATFEVPALEDRTNITLLVNIDNVAIHISRTIIGELYELEVVRKLAPFFRQFRSMERDLMYLEERQAADTAMLGLRITPPEPAKKEEKP